MLDEFLVFSDHHAHTFPFGAKEVAHDDYFVNSRLSAAYSVVGEIDAYARANGINKVFFCGDLFHVREAVPTVALTLMHEAIQAMQASVYMIPGNHDYADRDGNVHSLALFHQPKHKPARVVYDWRSAVRSVVLSGTRSDNVRYSFVPYTDDRDKAVAAIKEAATLTVTGEPHILFAHLGIQGAKVGSDYVLVSDNDLSVADIPWQRFTACFFGHYHEHQQLFQNGWYVGASHAHNWGDANRSRGFLHVKVYADHATFEFVETSAPKFILSSEGKVSARAQDFVRVLTQKKHGPDELEGIRKSSGSDNCEVVYVPPELVPETMELSEENLSPTAMVAAWVTSNAAWLKAHLPDVPPAELTAYGTTLLAESSHDV